MRIDPKEFRDRGVLQHHRLAHVERRSAVMRERRPVNRGESRKQYHHHHQFHFHGLPPLPLPPLPCGFCSFGSLPAGSPISFRYSCCSDGMHVKSSSCWFGTHRKYTSPILDGS